MATASGALMSTLKRLNTQATPDLMACDNERNQPPVTADSCHPWDQTTFAVLSRIV
jgi:hypothetical protein